MAQLTFSAPLQWPATYSVTPRMRQRTDSGFSPHMTLDESLDFLQEEISTLDPQSAVLFTDIENISTPRTRHEMGKRSGVCLQFKLGNKLYIFACDRWQKLEHNLYVMHLTLRQLRSIEKWGVASLEELLAPFLAGAREKLEAATSEDEEERSSNEWMDALGLGPTATIEDATAVYHRRAKGIINPDSEEMIKLNAAMTLARQALGKAS